MIAQQRRIHREGSCGAQYDGMGFSPSRIATGQGGTGRSETPGRQPRMIFKEDKHFAAGSGCTAVQRNAPSASPAISEDRYGTVEPAAVERQGRDAGSTVWSLCGWRG
jgi:hypothetical protein